MVPGTVLPFSIDLLWDGVNANVSSMPPGGFPLNFDAYFLNGHFNIDNATVYVIIAHHDANRLAHGCETCGIE